MKPIPREGCKGKIAYASQAEAEAARHVMRKDFRRTGGGKALRKLQSYGCADCGQWHIGHSSRKGVKLWKLETPKVPTVGQLLRRLRKIEERMDKHQRHRAHVLGQLIQRQAEAEVEAEARRAEIAARVADLADSIRIANQL
jgi:hypothetical protein